jgi:xanthine dehydrogenase accessory factor
MTAGPEPIAMDDAAPLRLVMDQPGTALCTLVGIEGSFSRAVGAQLSIAPGGAIIGSLADGCLEAALVREAEAAGIDGQPRLLRYGRGSPFIDIRLPCGGGLDILLDPVPDALAISKTLAALEARQPASLALPLPANGNAGLIQQRHFIPPLNLLLFGEGPELAALATLAGAMGFAVDSRIKGDTGMALGQPPAGFCADAWTAIILLFHDHEWERAILPWALETDAFFVGAQGGAPARAERDAYLAALELGEDAFAKLKSPIGLIPHARDPHVLALSVLAEVVGAYQALNV